MLRLSRIFGDSSNTGAGDAGNSNCQARSAQSDSDRGEYRHSPATTFEHWRFLEMNRVPGDGAPLVAPFSHGRNGRY
jgi:hypothetical protein